VTNYVSPLAFLACVLPGLVLTMRLHERPLLAVGVLVVSALAGAFAAIAIRLAAEWERGVVFRLGKLRDVRGPGLYFVIPLVDEVRVVDTRVQASAIARQQVITKDNVPVTIDGVLFFRVVQPAHAITRVQNFHYAIEQYARTSLRDVVGQMTLDQLLAEREQIEAAIAGHVEHDTSNWGLHVVGIRMEDIDVAEELRKMMSRQASAEREKRANITKAEGDRDAAVNLALAARTMAESPGSMQLRTLQTIDGLGPTASNTVLMAIPVEVMELIRTAKTALSS
jgi:regulator of protease activity HflC (stomatin/prohibitin superfamily)